MLSTVNQHKSRITTESVRSITLVSKAASRFSIHKIPEHFHSKLAMSIALSMGVALTGCGGAGSPTTRTDSSTTPPGPTVRTSYNLTVQSPVLLKNVRVTATDTATGDVIGQSIIQNGNDTLFAVPIKYIKTENVILLTLSPVDSSSQYHDPMLNHELGAMTTFNKPLHALVSLNKVDSTTKIDPFSEIVYERALIRSGALSINNPKLNRLTYNQLSSATNELSFALGSSLTTGFTVLFNTPELIAAINTFTTANSLTTVNVPAINTMVALGQLALYAQNNLSDTTPYLNFATRTGLDLLDGDLDGMTIVGGETTNSVAIANPILYSNVTSQVNNDPNSNNINSLITINAAQRTQRWTVLKQATTQYFNNLNAALPLALRTDTASLNYILAYDYATYAQYYSNGFSLYGTNIFNTAVLGGRLGAGNYTLAFGLPTGTDFKKALDASDFSTRSNDIMQLNGTYQGINGCKLEVGYDGTIQLSQGTQTYQAVVNRKFSDSLRRYPLGSDHYILNVTSADLTAPRFIQIRTIGAQIVSVEAGRSSNQAPIPLDTIELHCDF